MNSRIREVRKTLHLSQQAFAEKIGLKQNAVSYMEKCGSTVTEHNIKAICAQFHVREEWLRHGQGPIFMNPGRQWEQFSRIFDSLVPEYQEYLLKSAEMLLEIQKRAPNPEASRESEENGAEA